MMFFFLLLSSLLSSLFQETLTYRIGTTEDILSPNVTRPYSQPLDGLVGIYGDPSNFQRERINEGSAGSATQELLYEGSSPRQNCPSMIGPFSDGSYYCTAREYGYCDRRSGTCFCNTGYQGIDCSECQPTHYMLGNLCYSKRLCVNDCNNAGRCNYNNGTCDCLPHRTGEACETKLCTGFSSLCASCNAKECLMCITGHYLTYDSSVCGGCETFDPRCSSCTKKKGCITCSDSLLTSIRRSGYRTIDPPLPLEEATRQLSTSFPFGTKDPDFFQQAEPYSIVRSPTDIPLKNTTVTCSQGLSRDNSSICTIKESSHIVCGNKGTFEFSYPHYTVNESYSDLRLTVSR
jgi:hypothetical protein